MKFSPLLILLAFALGAEAATGEIRRNLRLVVERVRSGSGVLEGREVNGGKSRRISVPPGTPISRLAPERKAIELWQIVIGDKVLVTVAQAGAKLRTIGVRVLTPPPPGPSAIKWHGVRFDPLPVDGSAKPPADIPWHVPGARRLIAAVPAVEIGKRENDQAPALIPIDFAELTGAPVDTGSIRVFSVADGEGVAARWYDADVPWEHPEVVRGINSTQNKPRTSQVFGLAHSYLPSGRGRSGHLGILHWQRSDAPTYYAVYFKVRYTPDSLPATNAWLGDGQVLAAANPDSTFATDHVRIDLADFNGDGLVDIIAGEQYGQLMWLPNSGTRQRPRFNQIRLIQDARGNPLDAGVHAAPLWTDWDGDGMNDLLVGTYVNRISFFRNVGSKTMPRFEFVDVLRRDNTPLELPHAPIRGRDEAVFRHDYYPVLETADVNADGRRELIAAGYVTGGFFTIPVAARDGLPKPIADPIPWRIDGQRINVGDWCAAPGLADLDGDGLPDLMSGAMPMTPESTKNFRPFRYYRNVGTPEAWKFVEQEAPFVAPPGYLTLATPRFADLDADGDLDLVASAGRNIWIIPNEGDSTKPRFRQPARPLSIPGGPERLPVEYFLDYDRDGRPDAIKGYTVRFNRSEGTDLKFSRPKLILPAHQSIRHDSGIGDDWFWPRLSDFDRDGDWDILFGDWHGTIWLHRAAANGHDRQGEQLRHTDDTLLQVGPQKKRLNNDGFNQLQGARTVFVAEDFDQDGRTDLVIGDNYGEIYFARNTTDNRSPRFAPLVKFGNLRTRLMLDAGDWNGDGRPDLVAGAANGRTLLFLNQGGSENACPFAKGFSPDLPPIKQPRLLFVDLNGDGDLDLFSPSMMGPIWIERSFIENGGYAPGTIVKLEAARD